MKFRQHFLIDNKGQLDGKMEKSSQNHAKTQTIQTKYWVEKNNADNNADIVQNWRKGINKKSPTDLSNTS